MSDCGLPEDGFQIEHAHLVLRHDRHPIAVRGEFVEEGHRRSFTAPIEQAPFGAGRFGLRDHGQHRRYSDPARDEQVARAGDQGKVVARPANTDRCARSQQAVHQFRAAAAVRRAEHAHSPDSGFRRAAAQRVLPGQVIAENEVDVGAWRPRWELGAIRSGKNERHNVVCDGPRLFV